MTHRPTPDPATPDPPTSAATAEPGRRWEDLTSPDVATLDPARTVALLPVAAVEQHGPHLPLATDRLIVDALARRAVATPRVHARVLALPTLAIGHSPEHAEYPGTLTLSAETLLALWTEVARGVARAGVRKLVLLNAHGGQAGLVDVAAVRWRAELSLVVVRANYFLFGVPEGLFAADELAHGLHGGEVETSLLLHLHPELVRRERLRDFRGRTHARAGRALTPEASGGAASSLGYGWLASDLHPDGVVGNAAAADATRGARYFEFLCARLDAAIEALAAAEPEELIREEPSTAHR